MKLDPPPKKEGSFNDPPVLIQTFQKYTKKRLRCEIPETPLPTPSELWYANAQANHHWKISPK